MTRFASDQDQETCRMIHRKYGTTYYISTMRFPKPMRQRVHAIYAFVRVPDEWVDNPGGLSVAERTAKLSDWRADMHRGLRGELPEHPVMRAYCDVANECGIPVQEAEKFIDAMQMDLTISRYETYQQLRDYMSGSASAVGVLMCYAMGADIDEGLLAKARALGEAMQLTNFLRDIGEDLERGRIYMPLDELAQFALRPEDLMARRNSSQFKKFMQFEIQRARDLYAISDEGIHRLPKDMKRAVLVARVLYSKILDQIEANDYDVFSRRARTTTAQKLWFILKVSLGLVKVAQTKHHEGPFRSIEL